ncbi:MAG TPA: aminoglycoside phosphotransferase family protein [Gaiellaceae bacterium]
MIWTDLAWRESAIAWISRHVEVAGEIEQPHVRPWATAMRVPTPAGAVWFKASIPLLAHEGAVVEVLARRQPDLVPELIALDRASGWMLQRDAGTRLRELAAGRELLDRWAELLPLYADLQLDAAVDRDVFLDAGAPDRRLAALPSAYARLVEDVGGALSADERRAAHALEVERLCDELAAPGVPETIQHDDFHDGNVFVRDGRYVFFDWGDACVSHPFFTLVVTLGSVGYGLELGDDAPELARLRDAYLEPWTRFAPLAALRDVFPIAHLLGRVCRALAWSELSPKLPPPFDEEYVVGAVEHLRAALAEAAVV